MLFYLSLIALQVSGLLSQTITCTVGPSIPTFDQCVRDALNINGNSGAADEFASCAGLQAGDQGVYYKCLCDRSTSVAGCYETFCSGGTGLSRSVSLRTQFCGAVESIPRNPTAPAPSNSPLPPLPVFGSSSSATASATASSTPSAKAKNSGVKEGVAFGSLLLAVMVL